MNLAEQLDFAEAIIKNKELGFMQNMQLKRLLGSSARVAIQKIPMIDGSQGLF